jgi:hypothetical protein
MSGHDNCYCAKYPAANEVVDGLFVGSWNATERKWLSENGIQSLLTIVDRVLETPDVIENHVSFYMDDSGCLADGRTFKDILPLCLKIIDDSLTGGKRILVHCECGKLSFDIFNFRYESKY